MTKDGIAGRLKIGGKPKNLMQRIANFLKRMIGIKESGEFATFDELMAAVAGGQIAARPEEVRTLRVTEKELGAENIIPERWLEPGVRPRTAPTPEKTPEGKKEQQKDDWVESRRALPMDHASRMARAEQMGFDTSTIYYHGTKELIDKFEARFPDGLIFFSRDPKFASDWVLQREGMMGEREYRNKFTEEDEQKHKAWRKEANDRLNAEPDEDRKSAIYDEMRAKEPPSRTEAGRLSDSTVYPVFLKKGKLFDPRKHYKELEPLLLSGDMPGTGWDQIVEKGNHKVGNWIVYENEQVVNRLKELGYGSMLIKESSLEGEPHDTVAVWDDSAIRSINARFDPARGAESDIMESRRTADRDTITTLGQEQLNDQQRASLERKQNTARILIAERTAEERGGGRDAGIRFDRSRSTGRDGSLRVLGTFSPNAAYQAVLNEAGIEPVTVNELAANNNSAGAFTEAIERSKYAKGGRGRKGSLGYGAAVYVYPQEDYAGMRLFMSQDHQYGFAIKPDGDIVSVFSDGGGKAYPMLALATELGGTKLDAFDTILPRMYRVAGFREVARDPWNEDYRPEGWDKEVFGKYNRGEPDVVYMQYDAAYDPYAEADAVFSVRGRTANYTTDRLQNLWSEYGYNDGRVVAAVVRINPADFLAATTDNVEMREQILSEIEPLDVDRLTKESQTPFVDVSQNSAGEFEINTHEGRHRMQALADAGVSSVPLVLKNRTNPSDRDTLGLGSKGALTGEGYTWDKSEQTLNYTDALDISSANWAKIKEEFGGEEAAPKTTTRTHDEGRVAEAVALNKSVAESHQGVPRFSPLASPEAQFVARNPEAGLDVTEADIMFSNRSAPISDPRVQAIVDANSGSPQRTNIHTAMQNTLGAFDTPSRVEFWLTKFKQDAINKVARLEKLHTTTHLRENLADSSSLAAMMNVDRAMGYASAVVKYGRPVYEGGILQIREQGEEGGGLGLFDVMKILYTEGGGNHVDLAKTYAIAQHGKTVAKDGKAVPINAADAALIEAEVERLTDASGYNPIKHWYKEWQGFNESIINLMEVTGVINQEAADKWREAATYYPFYRVAEGGSGEVFHYGQQVFGGMTGAVSLKAMKGGETPINMDMVEAIMLNMSAAIQMSLKNVAQQRVVRDLTELGLAKVIPVGQHSTAHVVEFKYKGEHRRAEIYDPLVYQSLLPLEGTELVSMIQHTFGKPATWLRELVTRSPGFMAVNLLRDSLSSYATSGARLIPLVSTAKGLADGAKMLEKLGVVGGYDLMNDPEHIGDLFDKMVKKEGFGPKGRGHGLNLFRTIWDALGEGTTISDAATRNAVFKDVLARTGNIAEAAYQAREVINFGRRGRHPLARMLTAVVPFLNARFQGIDVFYRAYTGQYTANKENNRKQIIAAALARSSLLASVTALYYLLVSDDDQYKNASDYQRDNNWIIPTPLGVPVFLAIPFEVGIFTKVIPETILAATLDDRSGHEIRGTVNRAVASTLEIHPFQIQFAGPLLEAAVNHNTFTDRQIVPQHVLDTQVAGLQAKPWTTELAKWVGKQLNISPMKVDHVINGYSGTMGGYAFSLLDTVLKSETLQGDTRSIMPQRHWWDYPVIRRFMGTLNGRGLQEDFYELDRAVTQAYSSMKDLQEAGRAEELQAFIKGREMLLGLRGPMSNIKQQLGQLRRYRDQIARSQLSAKTKQEQTDAIEAQMNLLLKGIVPIMKEQADLPFHESLYYD